MASCRVVAWWHDSVDEDPRRFEGSFVDCTHCEHTGPLNNTLEGWIRDTKCGAHICRRSLLLHVSAIYPLYKDGSEQVMLSVCSRTMKPAIEHSVKWCEESFEATHLKPKTCIDATLQISWYLGMHLFLWCHSQAGRSWSCLA